MDSHLMKLLDEGVVTAQEAHRCAVDKRTFESRLPKDPPPG